jgi:LysR family glycine cleavage system transcriptional activator
MRSASNAVSIHGKAQLRFGGTEIAFFTIPCNFGCTQRARRRPAENMSRRLPNLNALRAFEAAARHLSFSRAADELCVTQGAISRQVRTLELELGVLLFRRMTRAVELTDEGKEYLPAAKEAFDRVEQATLDLTKAVTHKLLTVSVLPTFAMRWLIPRLHRFSASHPTIEVRMVTSIMPVNFGKDQVDVAIRVGHLPDAPLQQERPRIDLEMVSDWNSVHADMLLPDVLIPVCSPALLAKHDPPTKPIDLLRFELLHMASRPRAWPDWFRSFGIQCPPSQGAQYGHFFMAIEAAIEVEGFALVPRALAESDIASGKLVAPILACTESDGAYYILCRRQQRDVSPIRQFRKWLFTERDASNSSVASGSGHFAGN